ncbi:MAG TPA: nucleoside deaminase [Nevskiaceae bacterium]|nr:nucleoside deaminase [Nevskiaceae bacterium]
MTEEQIEQLIQECQVEASKSIKNGNPPFGCVITDADGNIVAQDHNTQNSDNDPTAHAEIKALRQLGKSIGSRYLDGYIMFANASSCSMCTSGSVKARITQFYYGAPPEPSMNPWLPMEEVAAKCKNPVEVHGPILGDECAAQIAQGRETGNQTR